LDVQRPLGSQPLESQPLESQRTCWTLPSSRAIERKNPATAGTRYGASGSAGAPPGATRGGVLPGA